MISAGLRVANVVLAVQERARDMLVAEGIAPRRVALFSTLTSECGLLVDEEIACTVTTSETDGVYSIDVAWAPRFSALDHRLPA